MGGGGRERERQESEQERGEISGLKHAHLISGVDHVGNEGQEEEDSNCQQRENLQDQ